MSPLVPLTCWSIGALLWVYNRNGFKDPTSRLIPRSLRHTWISGLCVMTIMAILCLPGWILGYHLATTLVFSILLVLTRKRGLMLMVDDLRLHRMDGRSLLEHSDQCYMTGGKVATFFKKRRERLEKNPKELFR